MTIGLARTMPFPLWPCGPGTNIEQCQTLDPKRRPEGGPLRRLSDLSAARRALKLLCDLSIAQRGPHYLAGLLDTLGETISDARIRGWSAIRRASRPISRSAQFCPGRGANVNVYYRPKAVTPAGVYTGTLVRALVEEPAAKGYLELAEMG